MLQLSTRTGRVYDLRTRINPTIFIPYFTRIDNIFYKKSKALYQYTYIFEKTHSIKTHMTSSLPLLPGSQMERAFVSLIYQYMELETNIKPSEQIIINPLRLSVASHIKEKVEIQPYIQNNHSGLVCISRENVIGGIYKTCDFDRELTPMEMIIGINPLITPLEYHPTTPLEGHIDLILFSKK